MRETKQKLHSRKKVGKLNSEKSSYQWVQNVLSLSILCKNVNIIIYNTIPSYILYSFDTWPHTIRQKNTSGYVWEELILDTFIMCQKVFGKECDRWKFVLLWN